MSIENLLNHVCDIYHLNSGSNDVGYGLPTSKKYDYPEVADEANVKCHFSNSGSETISQGEPMNVLQGTMKLTVPIGTDVRLNDKIVNKENGLAYTAGVPYNVRNHHQYVILRRTSQQEAL